MITHVFKSYKVLIICLITASFGKVQAQASLDKYIETGLKNNLVLQQKNIGLEKAMYSLKTANSLFLPSIGIKGDYQSGEGGRSIAIPLGDIMNPVYGTLNQLTMSNAFPQISNVETNFLPNNFYDAKIRTTLPIINSDLIYNHKIQKQQVSLQTFEVEIYKTELIRSIKVAYYNFLSATQAVSIYESALTLAKEGKRINESLVKNGKGVSAYVLRSESEIQNLQAAITTAQEKSRNAQLYFNFLINVDATQSIDTFNTDELDETKITNYLLTEVSTAKRTELKALETSASVYENVVKMNKAFWTPKLNSFLDLGSQAQDWKYNQDSRYYFVGLQLDVPLFAAGKNSYKTKQSKLDLQNHQLNSNYISKQIQLSAEVAKNNLKSSFENYTAGKKQLEAAKAYYNLIDKGYKEGVNTFIETVDARNQLTAASLLVIINKYQMLAAVANYERETTK